MCYNNARKGKKGVYKMRTIYFDMDGTIADLYGVNGWLDMLRAADTTPYEVAKPLVRLSTLARMLNKLQKEGYRIGIISWLAKNSTIDYDNRVRETKKKWLARHLPSVKWDEIYIVNYGVCKDTFNVDNDILFDDEDRNRAEWTGTAFNVNAIFDSLKSLKKN